MAKAKLVILRHGQTEYNKQHLMTGQADVALTAVGEDQAREAGTLIRDIKFDKAYSSHLKRAFNTAALALKSAGQEMHVEQRREIAEIHAGDFTGRNYRTDPEVIVLKRDFETPLPGGESDRQAYERVLKFYESDLLPRLEKGENVLVIAHAGILRAFDVVLGIEPIPADGLWVGKKRRIPNAGPSVYEYEDGKMTGYYYIENPKTSDAANENQPPVSDKKRGPKI